MRVLLVSPIFHGTARGFPLGLGYLAAVLENNGFDVHVLDMTVEGVDNNELVGMLDCLQPDVVGVSSVCATYLNALEVLTISKQVLGPSVTTVMGGPHVLFGAETVLARHNEVDYCVLGEAENSLPNLLRQLDRRKPELDQVGGIALRIDNKVMFSKAYPQIPDLDTLPMPARHLFDVPKYTATIGAFEYGSPRNAELIASRGCPYLCGFCSTKEFWGQKYRKRSPEHIIAELTHLVSLGYTDLYFDDDIFTIQRKWVLELCTLILKHELPIRWACGTRVDRIDRELLLAMKQAGCHYIYFGVESGDEDINRLQKKQTELSQIEAAYDLMRELNIYSSAALIFGLPGETWDTAKQTIDWVSERLQPEEVWTSKASCYPGTALAHYYNITAEDYEIKINGRCSRGWIYGWGGVLTPFFCNEDIVIQIWDYIHHKLGDIELGFGDELYPYVASESSAQKINEKYSTTSSKVN